MLGANSQPAGPDHLGRAYPVLPQLVALVGPCFEHLSGIFALLLVRHLRERNVRDIEYPGSLNIRRAG